MEKRNIIALIVILVVVVIAIWYFFLGGTNPFVPNINVHVHSGIACGALWTCWWDEQVTMDYSVSNGLFNIFKPKPLLFYCGLGGGPQPTIATLEVTSPTSGLIYNSKQSQSFCNAASLDYYWSVPLSGGAGSYHLKMTICGEGFWGHVCQEKNEDVYWSGS